MAGVITTGNHPKALWPGMHKFWGREYGKHSMEWEAIFDKSTSKKNYEEDTEVTGFGIAPVKPQGEAVSYDSESQGPTTRYTHVVYGLGYIVTREEKEDNLYVEVSKKRIGALAFSMATTKNVTGANILNRGFTSTFAGGDGKELFATDHPTLSGDQSNELSTATDLAEASIEDLCIQIAKAKNSRGLEIAIRPECLVVPPDLEFEAHRILKSTLQSGTANNDTNALRSMGMFPKGVKVNHYLTDADAWFVKTNCPAGLTMFQRRALEFTRDNDFDTENAKAKSTERYIFGWTDWRGAFASPGA